MCCSKNIDSYCLSTYSMRYYRYDYSWVVYVYTPKITKSLTTTVKKNRNPHYPLMLTNLSFRCFYIHPDVAWGYGWKVSQPKWQCTQRMTGMAFIRFEFVTDKYGFKVITMFISLCLVWPTPKYRSGAISHEHKVCFPDIFKLTLNWD